MMERPDLTKLTEQQKDNLILLLFDYIERLEARVLYQKLWVIERFSERLRLG